MPTSRATRVTSEVNTLSCLIIVLTISAERKNSPFSGRPSTSSATVRSRSPCATAAIARVTSVVGHNRSSISELTEDSISPQAPSDRPSRTRWRVLPSRPTTWPTRSSWLAMRSLVVTISLNVSAILPMMPTRSPAMRTEKSPTRMACSACSNSARSWASPLSSRGAVGGIAGATAEPLAFDGSTTSVCLAMNVSKAARGRRGRVRGGEGGDRGDGRTTGRGQCRAP